MKKCNCKDLNLSSAEIQLKKNQINIVITREPDTPLISELRAQIAELREIGLEFSDLDRKIRDVFSELDLVSKTMLLELLSQEAFDALEEKEENVMYCII